MDIVIWIIALSLYALFWLWYCGVKGRLSKHEVEIFISSFEAKGLSERALSNIREFLEQDDGREFFMINLLQIKSPKRESQKFLMGYFKKFMSGMIPRGGHPLFLAKAVAKNIENLNFRKKNKSRIMAGAPKIVVFVIFFIFCEFLLKNLIFWTDPGSGITAGAPKVNFLLKFL